MCISISVFCAKFQKHKFSNANRYYAYLNTVSKQNNSYFIMTTKHQNSKRILQSKYYIMYYRL